MLAVYDVFTARAGDLGLGRAPGETMEQYRARFASEPAGADGLDGSPTIATRAAYASARVEPSEADEADQKKRCQ